MTARPAYADPLTALLALLPPEGASTASVWHGGRADWGPPTAPAANLDLIVIRAGARHSLHPTWRRRVAQEIRDRLAADGVAYVLVPPPSRALVRRALTRAGLHWAGAFLQRPRGRRAELLIPLAGPGGTPMRADALRGGSWRRRALAGATEIRPARAALTLAAPSVGLVVRKPGARTVFSWLYPPGTTAASAPLATIALSWRGLGGGATVTGGPRGAPDRVVAKVALDSGGALAAEEAALAHLGAAARRTGAAVPRVHGRRPVGHWEALIESRVPGRRAAEILRRDRSRLLPLLAELTAWLTRWHRATAVVAPLGEARATTLLVEPLGRLGPPDADWAEYRRRLAALAGRLHGRPAPLVATHNDLTMANVLWSDRHGLGVVDWASAKPEGLPLMDFFYAVVDAVHAAYGGTRVEAFDACFGRSGPYRSAIEDFRGRLMRSLALDPDLAAAAFHACFLHHAVNERRAAGGAAPGPFLGLVRRARATAAGEDPP